MKLKNKTAIVTGASCGLGFEIAKAFILEGAHTMICARNSEQLKKAGDELKKIAPQGVHVFYQVCDVTNANQVSQLVSETLSQCKQIDILVANAGIYGPKGPIDELNWDEWTTAIDINLKGAVLPCHKILPIFKKQRSGKIIFLSGGGATKPMPYLSAYATSKAAVVRFCETLADEVKSFNIDVNAVAPGALNTRLLEEILAAGPEKVGKEFYKQSVKQQQSGGTSLEVGAQLCTYLASSTSDGVTGKLISAVWDPWKNFAQYKNELNTSDIYTLRRIVPTDRGKDWDVKA